ncbi:MAG: hypothetical protein ABIR19_08565, partial [Ginsengibacter sp.]
GSVWKTVLTPFFNVSVFPITPHTIFVIAYPPLPWLGIMLAGFASARLFALPFEKQKKVFFKIGLGALLLFIAIRFINIYGDPVPWSLQKNTLYTFLSFMNVTKYPPSLLFCLVTLGIMFLIFAFTENMNEKVIKIVSVYGKVPLFYFLVHFYLIHITLLVIMFLQGFRWSQLDFASGAFGRPKGVESGLSLGGVYLVWIAIVIVLYKPCQWFGKYKTAHRYWWLRFL